MGFLLSKSAILMIWSNPRKWVVRARIASRICLVDQAPYVPLHQTVPTSLSALFSYAMNP